MVNILYHNILTPTHTSPINKKCQPWNSIVCDMLMEAKLTRDSIFEIPFLNICWMGVCGGGGQYIMV